MDKNELKKLAKSDKYISGIYNYCDRWCEKCAYTDKCLSFELSKSQPLKEDVSIDNKKFWKDLEKSFKMVKDMLNEYMKDHGIEPPSDEENEKISLEMKKIDEDINSNPIIKESRSYTKASGQLLKQNDYFTNELNSVGEDEESNEKIRKLQDCVEIILFYNSLIYVKLARSLHTYYSVDSDEQIEMEEDKLVSAKIAVVAVERSMLAWHFILENFTKDTNKVADIILHLNKIKQGIEKTIPHVINYKRPYFD